MSERKRSYFDLEPEDNWIGYLRTRLPYSFETIREEGSGQGRHYVLSNPHLLTGGFDDYHNYWRRGNIYYVMGKLANELKLSRIWREYRRLEAGRLASSEQHDVPYSPAINAADFYNSMQMEKLWEFCQQDNLDRERVVMTNISQALELCLKAVKTHAEYREHGTFTFHAGYDLNSVYESLPEALRDEIEAEAKIFARQYSKFRTQVEREVEALGKRSSYGQDALDGMLQNREAWNRIAARIEQSSYTALMNSGDPGVMEGPEGNVGHVPEDWFSTAMAEVKRSMYHRYSPYMDRQAYPPGHLYGGSMLARFMYEHLFPMALDRRERQPISDGLAGDD